MPLDMGAEDIIFQNDIFGECYPSKQLWRYLMADTVAEAMAFQKQFDLGSCVLYSTKMVDNGFFFSMGKLEEIEKDHHL